MQTLEPELQRQALAAGLPRAFRRGQTIFSQGEPFTGLHLIASGQVALYRRHEAGKELLLTTRGPGAAFDLAALADGGPTATTAVAVSSVQTRLLEPAVARRLFLRTPASATWVLQAVAADLRSTMELIRGLSFEDVPTRLVRALLELMSDGSARCSVRELASRVGTSREVASRHLHRLVARGWIAMPASGEIHILSVPDLRRAAEVGVVPRTPRRAGRPA